jgi:predicted nucleic acid-binding protein
VARRSIFVVSQDGIHARRILRILESLLGVARMQHSVAERRHRDDAASTGEPTAADLDRESRAVRAQVHRLEPLPIAFPHAEATALLPPLHRDPFDRLLVAQARTEGLTLVTRDPLIRAYPGVAFLPV